MDMLPLQPLPKDINLEEERRYVLLMLARALSVPRDILYPEPSNTPFTDAVKHEQR